MTKKTSKQPNQLITGNKRVIIAGAGRSGTTFLVLLLTRLGFYTGFRPYEEPTAEDWRAGAEFPYALRLGETKRERKKNAKQLPFILKSPHLSLSLKELYDDGIIDVGHVIIPVRDLDEATQSRLSVGLSWFNPSGQPDGEQTVPFGVERAMSATMLGTIVETCVTRYLPYSLPRFPEIITDADYCYRLLQDVFGELPFSYEFFREKFDELSDSKSVKTKGSKKYGQIIRDSGIYDVNTGKIIKDKL